MENSPSCFGIITMMMCPARTRWSTVAIAGLPLKKGAAKLTQYRIDDDHGNAYAAWLRMGSPQPPTAAQYAELEQAGPLAESGSPEKIQVNDGKAVVQLKLPRQAVSLLVLDLGFGGQRQKRIHNKKRRKIIAPLED